MLVHILRYYSGVAGGIAPRNDGKLLHRVAVGQAMRHDCVTDLMVCGDLKVFCGDNAAALFGAVENALDSFVDF